MLHAFNDVTLHSGDRSRAYSGAYRHLNDLRYYCICTIWLDNLYPKPPQHYPVQEAFAGSCFVELTNTAEKTRCPNRYAVMFRCNQMSSPSCG